MADYEKREKEKGQQQSSDGEEDVTIRNSVRHRGPSRYTVNRVLCPLLRKVTVYSLTRVVLVSSLMFRLRRRKDTKEKRITFPGSQECDDGLIREWARTGGRAIIQEV